MMNKYKIQNIGCDSAPINKLAMYFFMLPPFLLTNYSFK